ATFFAGAFFAAGLAATFFAGAFFAAGLAAAFLAGAFLVAMFNSSQPRLTQWINVSLFCFSTAVSAQAPVLLHQRLQPRLYIQDRQHSRNNASPKNRKKHAFLCIFFSHHGFHRHFSAFL
ncbi:MAG: hypothetical protein IT470_06865, partial [Pseudomonadales bacterium]|nr:hypothetical protein [Pseudomonadales bacterium]